MLCARFTQLVRFVPADKCDMMLCVNSLIRSASRQSPVAHLAEKTDRASERWKERKREREGRRERAGATCDLRLARLGTGTLLEMSCNRCMHYGHVACGMWSLLLLPLLLLSLSQRRLSDFNLSQPKCNSSNNNNNNNRANKRTTL